MRKKFNVEYKVVTKGTIIVEAKSAEDADKMIDNVSDLDHYEHLYQEFSNLEEVYVTEA